MDSEDLVTKQLKTLREGDGLTEGRLGQRGAVMSALGSADPVVAAEWLRAGLADLPDGAETRALRVDLDEALEGYLGRPPTEDERSRLGRRRAAYAEVIGRDVKTLSRWSGKALRELRSKLINDTFTGDLYITAAVDDGHIAGISLIREDPDQPADSPTRRDSLDLLNSEEAASLPCILYAFPRDWSPRTLTFVIAFRKSRPARVSGFHAENFISASFAADRHDMQLNDGIATCRFVHPQRAQVYGVGWCSE